MGIIGSLSFAFTVGRVDMFHLRLKLAELYKKVILCIFLSKLDEIFMRSFLIDAYSSLQ